MNQYVLAIVLLVSGIIATHAPAADRNDPSLLLHYNFAQDPGNTAKDLSGNGHDGQVEGAVWLPSVEGRSGLLRFNGKDSAIICPPADSLKIDGDLTLEMWIRLNEAPSNTWGNIFTADEGFQFTFAFHGSSLVMYYRSRSEGGKIELSVVPFEKHALSEQWAHIAVVFAYPRCRFYLNGELINDNNLAVPGVLADQQVAPRIIGSKLADTGLAMDLTDVRLYKRALTPQEIAAHARDEEATPAESHEIRVEPDWYKDTATVRLTCTGNKWRDQKTSISIVTADSGQVLGTQSIRLKDVSGNGSGRYAATAVFKLSDLPAATLKIIAVRDGLPEHAAEVDFTPLKPDWINTREGYTDTVPAPWVPMKASEESAGAVSVAMLGRTYTFSPDALLSEVTTWDKSLLAGPIALRARANGTDLQFKSSDVKLVEATDMQVAVQQAYRSAEATFSIDSVTEYDGYTIYDCTFTPLKQLEVESLQFDIPLKSEFATLCYGDRTMPLDPQIPISEWYSGAVTKDLSFRFGPVIWIGNEEVGLCWQAESDEHWRNTDPQQAIQIQPRGQTTHFRLNLIDQPTVLQARQPLKYQFALLATPSKPRTQSAWQMRIARSEPYGADLNLPDRKTDGMPTLEYYRKIGIRRLFVNVLDVWPWPLPVHQQFIDALHRLNSAAHEAGIKLHPYLIHQRIPVNVKEFDEYGRNMIVRPAEQYVEPGSMPGSVRPGPLGVDWGANSQGSLFLCSKSQALQDAYIHALVQRLDIYGDDGVYLDGTGQVGPLCENTEHGCGYYDANGKIHGTFATFANRKFMQRIYNVVKQHDPDGIMDVHCSWGYNPASLAYADVIWTGEQWFHLQATGAPAGKLIDVFPLEQFRTEFTGMQIGVPAEMITYRLGTPMRCAAVSLLHDISPRVSTGSFDNFSQASDPYYAIVPKLWEMRDRLGMEEAEKLYYWNNQQYVMIKNERCYTTLFRLPHGGVVAIVSNLSDHEQSVSVALNLNTLGIAAEHLKAINPLTEEAVEIEPNGTMNIPLGSETWQYVWIKNEN